MYMILSSDSILQERLKSISLKHFLDKEVDLGKFFTKEELATMNFCQQQRLKNIAQNYEIMMYMGRFMLYTFINFNRFIK